MFVIGIGASYRLVVLISTAGLANADIDADGCRYWPASCLSSLRTGRRCSKTLAEATANSGTTCWLMPVSAIGET